VLSNVESVIRRVYEICVVQDCRISAQAINDGIDEFVYRLEGLQPLAVPVIVVLYFRLVELSDRFEIRSCPRLPNKSEWTAPA
jgi:hypothetical protein